MLSAKLEQRFTKATLPKQDKKGRGVLINACCPGYVNTDMTMGNGVGHPDEGKVKHSVMLARRHQWYVWRFLVSERIPSG